MKSTPGIRSKTIGGMLWNTAEKLAIGILQFGIGIILARKLSPGDFGLLGMLTVFIVISQVFIDSGFSKALIQKQGRTDADYSTVFYFNLVVSVFIYIVLFCGADYIARFYKSPQLLPLTRVVFAILILNGLTVVQDAQLLIDVKFKTIAKINIVASLVSGIAGVAAAYLEFGVWALVLQVLLKSVVAFIIKWIVAGWWPCLVFSWDSFKGLFRFGSKLLASGLLSAGMTNIYLVIIGKLYNPFELGYYTRAMIFPEMSSGTVTSVFQTVTFPLLSSLQDDRSRMVHVYAKLLAAATMIMLPSMVMLAILSKPLILVLLTDKWLPSVPLLFWLALSFIFAPLSAINMNMLNAIGRSDLFLKLDLYKIPLIIIMMIVTFPMGLTAVVVGRFFTNLICFSMNGFVSGKVFGHGLIKQIRASRKIIIATIAEAVLLMILTHIIQSPIALLLVGVTAGLAVYIGSLIILKEQEFFDLLQIAKERLGV